MNRPKWMQRAYEVLTILSTAGTSRLTDPEVDDPPKLWVDFNDTDHDGELTTGLRFAAPGVTVSEGERVVVGDDEGATATAEVLSVSSGTVRLRLTSPIDG